MNIRDAAIQLEQTVRAYTTRTPEGGWRVPPQSQRPVYLMGPPGVGKTAAVAQVASRMGVGYAAYTMTHHTRQSALGLPLIVRRMLGGREVAVTEYTMSEIVASVWEKAESGAESGLLFLDEINCVAESLMPAILQLLQYKTFGVHGLPPGWVIVCAGNPPRYNRYAHTFDAVVMDRLRVINVEPDYDAWRDYAAKRRTHPAVQSYLSLRGDDFYVSDGDRIVTARSWTDLSDMMLALEAAGEVPESALFGQYLQVEDVARRFALYFRLCRDVGAKLDMAEGLERLPFDEAVFAVLLLAGRLKDEAGAAATLRREAEHTVNFVEGIARQAQSGEPVEQLCNAQIERLETARQAKIKAGLPDEGVGRLYRLRELSTCARGLDNPTALGVLREKTARAEEQADQAEAALLTSFEDTLDFVEYSFPDPNVRLVFISDLKAHDVARRFAEKHLKIQWTAFEQSCDPDVRVL